MCALMIILPFCCFCLQTTEIWYDPDPLTSVVPEDKTWVDQYYVLGFDEEVDPARITPWVLRIVLNREMMLDKSLTLKKIAEKISLNYEDFLYCIFTDDNADVLVLRVRPPHDSSLKLQRWPRNLTHIVLLQMP